MTNSNSNFTLINAKSIQIDGKDVKRIKIQNYIVYPKEKKQINIKASVSRTTLDPWQNFYLRATLTDDKGNPVKDENILNKIIFAGDGISGSEPVTIERDTGTKKILAEPKTIGTHTYTVILPSSSGYPETTSTIKVIVKKYNVAADLWGYNNVVDGIIGIRVKNIAYNTPIENAKVRATLKWKDNNWDNPDAQYEGYTNSDGIVTFALNIPTSVTKMKARYDYIPEGDQQNIYNPGRLDKDRIYLIHHIGQYLTKTLPMTDSHLGDRIVALNTQKWKTIQNGFQCCDTGQPCGGSNTIRYITQRPEIDLYSYYKPHDLKLVYEKQNAPQKIIKAVFEFDMQSLNGACTNANYGGFFPTGPDVLLSFDGGNGFIDAAAERVLNVSYKPYAHSTNDVIKHSAEWVFGEQGEQPILGNIVVLIRCCANSGSEEGCLKITNTSLKVSYLP